MIDRAVADAAFALKEGEISAPIKGMFGTTLVHVVKIEPEKVQAVRGGRGRDQADDRDRARAQRDRGEPRQDRGRARRRLAADRDRAEARPHRPHHRGGRPQRPRSGRQADQRPAAGVNVISSAFGSDVGVENEPLQMPGGGYRLVRGARRQAGARAHARRGPRAGRAALARRSGLRAAEGQGGRDCRQAEGRRARSTMSRPPRA